MAKIKAVFAQEILDSKGNPTIETIVELSDGIIGRSSVPTGATHGTYEAAEIRDTDNRRFNGMGVLTAIDIVNNQIAPKLLGIDASAQQKVDRIMIEMDGTQNKARLGANSMLSISQAVVKAAAKSSLLPLAFYMREFLPSKDLGRKLPVPIFTLLEGGENASNFLDFKEFLAVPSSTREYHENLEIGVTIYWALHSVLKEKNLSILTSDRGGFGPSVASNKNALDLLKEAIELSLYQFSLDVFLGVNAGGNNLMVNDEYKLVDRTSRYTKEEFINFYKELFTEYSLIYLEDPFAEDDWKAWAQMYSALSGKILIVGGDLTATNPYRLQMAVNSNVINGVLVKPSQIGTVSEAIAVCEIAKFKHLKIIVADRDEETSDDFIADFAVAVAADYVKFGAPVHERVIKYNRLSDIEKELKNI